MLLGSFSGLAAQVLPGIEPARLQVARVELEDLLVRYDSLAAHAADRETREAARVAGDGIRTRLEVGDFRAGDRIILEVEGEDDLPDTVVVEPGPQIVLKNMGAISLEGVLRSELEPHLRREVGRYIREPRLSAHAMVRLAVEGSVGRPGFYLFRSDMMLQDVIMAAGGPTRDAELDEMALRRRDVVLMEKEAVQVALAEGRSLDQLNLRGGDVVEVPTDEPSRVWPTIFRWSVIATSSLLLGVRLF